MKMKDCYNGGGITCDTCACDISNEEQFLYHCPKERNDKHKFGYDICEICAEDLVTSKHNKIKSSSTIYNAIKHYREYTNS